MTSRWAKGLRALGCAGVTAILLVGCSQPPRPGIAEGETVPALVLDGLEGGKLDSAGWRGRTVVLNLWATWCVPCREEMPALARLGRELDPGRFLLIGLALDSDRNLVREFALQYGVTFSLAMDPAGRVARDLLGSQALPDTLIIAPDGRLHRRVLGRAAWDSRPLRNMVLAAFPDPSASLGH